MATSRGASAGASRGGAPAAPGGSRGLAAAFLVNERVNQVLLGLLDPAIWDRFPPSSKRRNIATSFAHLHNVRCMRLKMSGRGAKVPERLDRARVSREQAAAALARSARAMVELIERAEADGGRVAGFPPGVAVLVIGAVTHEAHHRGQICHWARELGAPLTPEQQLGMWDWNRLWKSIA